MGNGIRRSASVKLVAFVSTQASMSKQSSWFQNHFEQSKRRTHLTPALSPNGGEEVAAVPVFFAALRLCGFTLRFHQATARVNNAFATPEVRVRLLVNSMASMPVFVGGINVSGLFRSGVFDGAGERVRGVVRTGDDRSRLFALLNDWPGKM